MSVYLQQGLTLRRKEIARYLGCRGGIPEGELAQEIELAAEALEQGSYRVSWVRLPLAREDGLLHFGSALTLESRDLAENLKGCEEAVLFCATLGPSVDRAIRKNRLHPSLALVWDAVGTAAIEQLCDDFCSSLPRPQRPRFSPGYGDLPLETQGPLLQLLEAERLLGVGLTDSLLMTPTKSVTAFVGLL